MAGPALAGTGDPAHVQVADVAVQPLDPADAEVVQPPPLPHGQPPGLVVLGLARRARPVAGLAGRRPGPPPSRTRRCLSSVISCRWLVTSSVSVISSRLSYSPAASLRLDRGGGLLGLLGEHVVGPQQRQRLGHDLAPGQLLGGQRPVVRHRRSAA